MTLQRLLRLVALVLFLATAIGFGTFSAGTVSVSLLALGLACWVASEL